MKLGLKRLGRGCCREGSEQVNEFMKIYEQYRDNYGWALTVYNSSIVDWCIDVGYKITTGKSNEYLFQIQECDMELAFAKAQVKLKEWLTENNGGY